jgi:diguanylate cyclase (GGDEF)-like protein
VSAIGAMADPRRAASSTFAARLLIPLALAGFVFVAAVAAVSGVAAREYARHTLDAEIARARATVDTVLAAQERELMIAASTFAARGRWVDIRSERTGAILREALRAYNTDLVAVVREGTVASVARGADVSHDRTLLLRALGGVTVANVDGRIWMVSAAEATGSVPMSVVMGRVLDDAFLEEVVERAGLVVAIRLEERGPGPETVSNALRVDYQYRTRYGDVLRVLLHASLVPHDATVRSSAALIAGAGLVALLLFLGVTGALVVRLTRPLRQLATVAAAVERGDLSVRAPTAGPSELATTGHAINQMIEAITAREGQLRSLHESAVELAEAREHDATHDALTTLPNRTFLTARLDEAVVTSVRDGIPVALALVDLDRFKEVNDTLGHRAGDEVLRQIAERLRGSVRAADTVARLGGDEFAILLPGVDAASALGLARKVAGMLAQPMVVSGRRLRVGGSIGIALCPDHAAGPTTLFHLADMAMYESKRLGLGPVVFSAEHETRDADGSRSVVAELVEA